MKNPSVVKTRKRPGVCTAVSSFFSLFLFFFLSLPMADFASMHFLDARENLVKKLAGLHFVDSLLLHDVVVELTPRGVLHDQIQILMRLDDLERTQRTKR